MLLIFSLLISSGIMGQTESYPYYYKATAKPGDGIFSLLRKFELLDPYENIDRFYELNNMEEGTALISGREYLLPLKIYQYNGISIRTTIGNNDYDKAVRIKTYNETIKKKGLRKYTYQSSKILWVPEYELTDIKRKTETVQNEIVEAKPISVKEPEPKKEVFTSKGGKRQFPIFGPEYAHVPLTDSKLAGKVYYIVSGHGGPDPGAVGKLGQRSLCEDEYAYDVALRLCRNLISHGAIAYMVTRDKDDGIRSGKYLECDTDEVIWENTKIPRRQLERLNQRASMVNKLYKRHKAQGIKDQKIFMFNIDSRPNNERIDVFFYHSSKSRKGKSLAKNMLQTMEKKYNHYQKNREYRGSVSARDLYMLRNTLPVGVYIEMGNLKNSLDQKRFLLESNRQALADWLTEGLM